MNRENAKDYLPLVQALAEGKTIQLKCANGTWEDITSPSFDLGPEQYRIKPEAREIWVNHYNEGLKLDQVCDSRDEADRRVHEGYGIVQKRYREVIE